MSRDGARNALRHFGTIAGFAALIVFNLAPIVWSVRTSLMAPSDIFAYPPKWLDFAITLEHYERIVKSGYFQTFRNSIAYSLAAIAIGLIIGLLAAYGFDRFRFLGKKAMFFLVVFCIPLSMGSSALIIPNYLYFSKLGLLDGWFTLPLLYTAYN